MQGVETNVFTPVFELIILEIFKILKIQGLYCDSIFCVFDIRDKNIFIFSFDILNNICRKEENDMSRVWKPNSKYTNNTKYSPEVTNYPKMKRSKTHDCDYTKTGNFSTWLFLKYEMTYKTYRNKSKNRRAVMKEEFLSDTNEYRNSIHTNIIVPIQ